MSCRRIATDSATLALVRQSLTERFKLPASVTIENIQTLAGGYVAFRFVCEASLGGIDRQALPRGQRDARLGALRQPVDGGSADAMK